MRTLVTPLFFKNATSFVSESESSVDKASAGQEASTSRLPAISPPNAAEAHSGSGKGPGAVPVSNETEEAPEAESTVSEPRPAGRSTDAHVPSAPARGTAGTSTPPTRTATPPTGKCTRLRPGRCGLISTGTCPALASTGTPGTGSSCGEGIAASPLHASSPAATARVPHRRIASATNGSSTTTTSPTPSSVERTRRSKAMPDDASRTSPANASTTPNDTTCWRKRAPGDNANATHATAPAT